jgi:hypothetical protein
MYDNNKKMYKKYLIAKTDSFHATQFPNMVNELNVLKKNIVSLQIAYKEEILISYFKKRSLEPDWIMANPDLSSLISSGVFKTVHLEALFECSEGNKEFQKQYETYLRNSFAEQEIWVTND